MARRNLQDDRPRLANRARDRVLGRGQKGHRIFLRPVTLENSILELSEDDRGLKQVR
jgi:hypothetical protein